MALVTITQDYNTAHHAPTLDARAAELLNIDLNGLDAQQRLRFDSVAAGVALPLKALRRYILDNPSVVR